MPPPIILFKITTHIAIMHSPQQSSAIEEARHWLRHNISATVFFMLTKNEEPIQSSSPHLEGEVKDVSEMGFRLESSYPLESSEQISFEIMSANKVIFSGVGEVIHGNNDQTYGVRFIKIRKH